MESLRQIGIGILLAAISITIILGGFTLATAESNLTSASLPVTTETSQPTIPAPSLPTEIPSLQPFPTLAVATITLQPTLPPEITKTLEPTKTSLPSVTPAFTSTNTFVPTATKVTTNTPLPVVSNPVYTTVPTTVACGAPYGWINYYVVAGDTLYGIGIRYGVSVYQLQTANCLGNSVSLQVGKQLKVPNVATLAPVIVPTAVIIPTTTPVSTDIPAPTAEPPTLTSEPSTFTPVPELPTITPTGPYGGLGGG